MKCDRVTGRLSPTQISLTPRPQRSRPTQGTSGMTPGARQLVRRDTERRQQRSRSRTPPRRRHDSLLAEQLKLSQGEMQPLSTLPN